MYILKLLYQTKKERKKDFMSDNFKPPFCQKAMFFDSIKKIRNRMIPTV